MRERDLNWRAWCALCGRRGQSRCNKWAVDRRRRSRPGTVDAAASRTNVQRRRVRRRRVTTGACHGCVRRADRPSSTSVIGHNAPPSMSSPSLSTGARVRQSSIDVVNLTIGYCGDLTMLFQLLAPKKNPLDEWYGSTPKRKVLLNHSFAHYRI